MIVIISDITFAICAQGRKLNTPSAHSQKNTTNKQKPQTIYYMIKKHIFTWNWSVDELWGCEEGYL